MDNTNFNNPEVVSLKEYINDKLDNLEKSVDARFDGVTLTTNQALAAADKANIKAENATEKRFEGVNEFRQTLSDQAAKFIIRSEFELVVNRLEQDIKNLVITRADMVMTKQYETGVKDVQKQVDDLKLNAATLAGKASQESVNEASSKAQTGLIFGAIGTILAIAGFLMRFL